MAPLTSQRDPSGEWQAITLDQMIPEHIRGLYCGGAGNAVLEDQYGHAVPFYGMLAGVSYALRPRRILSSHGGVSTTATNLVALF